VLTIALTAALTLMTPAAGGASAQAAQFRGARAATGTGAEPSARPFNGTKAVGALFLKHNGRLTHFCSASVVDSPAGDLVITAAHCMQGVSLKPAGSVLFAPDYHGKTFPFGRWTVRESITDSQWQKNRNPDDDFAFLIVGRAGSRIERHTGAETLKTGTKLPQHVQVIGYPDATSKPVTCARKARAFTRHHLHQMVFDCPGYTDGTSGGPFLTNVKPSTGAGDVIGVIGGFEEGGNTPSVSYSAQFLANMAALYTSVTS
jgi:V8-like Glu-specific endopeptidase